MSAKFQSIKDAAAQALQAQFESGEYPIPHEVRKMIPKYLPVEAKEMMECISEETLQIEYNIRSFHLKFTMLQAVRDALSDDLHRHLMKCLDRLYEEYPDPTAPNLDDFIPDPDCDDEGDC